MKHLTTSVALTMILMGLAGCTADMRAADSRMHICCRNKIQPIEDHRSAIKAAYGRALKEPANTFTAPLGTEEQWLDEAEVTAPDASSSNWTVWPPPSVIWSPSRRQNIIYGPIGYIIPPCPDKLQGYAITQ